MFNRDKFIEDFYKRLVLTSIEIGAYDRHPTKAQLQVAYHAAVAAADAFERAGEAAEEARRRAAAVPPQNRKEFKVAAVSENTNSFGLTGVVLVARDGEVWEIGVNSLHKAESSLSKTVWVPLNANGTPDFGSGVEIPRRRKSMDPERVKAIFKNDA